MRSTDDKGAVLGYAAEHMIRFRCTGCGRAFRVSDAQAGKRGKCPKCKRIVVIPGIHATRPETVLGTPHGEKSDSAEAPANSEPLADHLTLLDVPKTQADEEEPSKVAEVSESIEHDEVMAGTRELKGPPERKLPWPIDVLLYPISKPGLITIGIVVLTPVLFGVARELLRVATLSFPPLIIFLRASLVLSILVTLVMCLYLYWYICECIRDSAAGGLRAPETLARGPGLGDMLLSAVMTFGCLCFFLLPMALYYGHSRRIDWVFWALTAYAVLFLPMGLLAVLMFESLWGLNPILLIGSLFRTFLQYLALVCLFLALGYLIIRVAQAAMDHALLAFPLLLVSIHVTLVAAHLLGRFYWRYQERLNWDV